MIAPKCGGRQAQLATGACGTWRNVLQPRRARRLCLTGRSTWTRSGGWRPCAWSSCTLISTPRWLGAATSGSSPRRYSLFWERFSSLGKSFGSRVRGVVGGKSWVSLAGSRFSRVYIPFLIWNAVCFFAFALVSGVLGNGYLGNFAAMLDDPSRWLQLVLMATWVGVSVHLWFLPALFAGSLALLLVVWPGRRNERVRVPLAALLIALGLRFAWRFDGMNLISPAWGTAAIGHFHLPPFLLWGRGRVASAGALARDRAALARVHRPAGLPGGHARTVPVRLRAQPRHRRGLVALA